MAKKYSAKKLATIKSVSHPKEQIEGKYYSGSEGKMFRTHREFEKHVDEHNLCIDPGYRIKPTAVFKYDKETKKVVRIR